MEVTSFNFLYMLEMLLPAIGLCIPLKKRKHGMGKAMTIIIVGTCLLGVLPIFYIKYYGTEMQQGILWVESVILMFVWFVLIWAILIFSIYFCTESSIYEAMYIFALSYGVEHIFYCIRVLVEHFTGGIIGNKHPLVYIPCLAGSFLLAYFWFAKGTVYEGKYPIGAISATTTSVVLMGIVWGLSIVMDYLGYAHIHSIYAILCCLFILTNQREQMKRETERIEFSQKEQLWEKTKLRYEMSKESIAVVNQHYHDMKHQLMILSTMSDEDKRKAKLQDMESKIAAYDAVVRTGNEYLDTVLTEKKLTCQSNQISMSCIADGSQLAFMDELDLYTLFGNALDNAIEANRKISNVHERWISVQIQNKKGILLVEIVNPYEGSLVYDSNHMPVTSKHDTGSHGFSKIRMDDKNIWEPVQYRILQKTTEYVSQNAGYVQTCIFLFFRVIFMVNRSSKTFHSLEFCCRK